MSRRNDVRCKECGARAQKVFPLPANGGKVRFVVPIGLHTSWEDVLPPKEEFLKIQRRDEREGKAFYPGGYGGEYLLSPLTHDISEGRGREIQAAADIEEERTAGARKEAP